MTTIAITIEIVEIPGLLPVLRKYMRFFTLCSICVSCQLYPTAPALYLLTCCIGADVHEKESQVAVFEPSGPLLSGTRLLTEDLSSFIRLVTSFGLRFLFKARDSNLVGSVNLRLALPPS